MNDYSFGNYLYSLRRKSGLSQTELAARLGVTNKAVSKWENGRAKPSTDALRQLAALWNISIDRLLSLRNEAKSMDISKIVITGGPCAGKTTALSRIQTAVSERGWTVLFVPETATELIDGGVAPWTCGSNLDYQTCQLRLQLEKEKIFEQAARSMNADKILIVCDRGAMDNRAYMTQGEFAAVLNGLNTSEVELRDGYDAVFHLVTAAKGAVEFYTTANNTARRETPEEAAALDDRLISAWTGHPHLRIIDNSADFDSKIRRLIVEIMAFLGEPEPFEIERKFLIKRPDAALLESLPNCQRADIIQTYLVSEAEGETRIRQRGLNGRYTYCLTTKRAVTALKRVEVERRLTGDEYLALLMNADPTRRPIRKTRWCLAHEGRYFEIDLYPFWDDQAIVEIELADEAETFEFPDWMTVIREVTDDPAYKNSALARL